MGERAEGRERRRGALRRAAARRHGGSRRTGHRWPGRGRRGAADAFRRARQRSVAHTSAAPDPTREMAEIRAEIEHKRAEISETIDEITERLSPGNLASQAGDAP